MTLQQLKYADAEATCGIAVTREGEEFLASAGKTFVAAIRECCAERSYDAAGL